MTAIILLGIVVLVGGFLAFLKLLSHYDIPTQTESRPSPTPEDRKEPTPTQAEDTQTNQGSRSGLTSFCLALRDYEGHPGDLNYILNNPGDCRCSAEGYLPKYGAVECVDTDTDPRYPYHVGKFAKFPTSELGWEYLLALVEERVKEHPEWTFYDFFANYAPSSDKNFPSNYAKFVAARCGVPPVMKISAYFA